MIELVRQYGRYGYRRVAVLLRDAGWQVNDKRVERLWRREGLKVPMKQHRKGRLWLNDGSCVRLRPEYCNHVWSYARAALGHTRATGVELAQALLAELDKRLPGRAEHIDRRIAIHEAGHVVVGMLSGLPAPFALRIHREGGSTVWEMPPLHSYDTALAEIRSLLGGRAAEQVLLGNVSNGAGLGPQSDLALATELAVKLETEWGLGDAGLIWHPNTPHNLRHGQQWLREKLNHILNTSYAEARTIIATHRELVLDLADAVLEERELTGQKLSDQLDKIKRVQRWDEGLAGRSVSASRMI